MKNYVLAMLALGFIIYGCKKDKDNNGDNNNTKVKLVTSSTWKYDTVALDINNDGKPDQAIPNGMGFDLKACNTDNTITFKSDSTGVINEGATKCDASDPQTTNFKWWFKENETVLYTPDPIFTAAFTGDFKVGELTSTRLRILKAVPTPIGSYTVVLDLKH